MNSFIQVLLVLSGGISIWIGLVRPHAFEERYECLSDERLVIALYSWSHEVGHRAFLQAARLLTTQLLIYALFMFTLEPLTLLFTITSGAMDTELKLLVAIAIVGQWVFLLRRLYAKRYPSYIVKPTPELVKLIDMMTYTITGWWMFILAHALS